jgi:SAM-dependent methyltransferase
MAAAHPGCDVTAVDLLPENVTIASTFYAHTRGLKYQVGDAMALAFADASFDKVLCLEAAFHFSDRVRFVSEVARVLKPGGRFVLVDFMWRDGEREAVLGRPETKIVQNTWGWDDFFSIGEYRMAIASAGLTIVAEHDWTRPVTSALQWQFDMFARLGTSTWGRRLVVGVNALLRGLGRGDWAELKRAAAAHRFVNKHSRYMVMVVQK